MCRVGAHLEISKIQAIKNVENVSVKSETRYVFTTECCIECVSSFELWGESHSSLAQSDLLLDPHGALVPRMAKCAHYSPEN